MLESLTEVFNEISGGNDRGESITLVGATKTIDAETVNDAIAAGLQIVGDNKVQEFRDKSPLIHGAEFHFIGHLQKNKVKYLIGKVGLIHSIDSFELAEEINRQSVNKGVTTNILLEVNIGGEENKSGFPPSETESAAFRIAALPNVKVRGLMAMLPRSDDEAQLKKLCLQMRGIYDKIKKSGLPLDYLSMGMSGDYRIAIANGSNMIRLGTRIFGKRNYGTEVEK